LLQPRTSYPCTLRCRRFRIFDLDPSFRWRRRINAGSASIAFACLGYAHATTRGGHITQAINLGATFFELLQQVESRTNGRDCFGLTEEERQEKEPIMSRILKNIAALALMVGALIGSMGTSHAQNYRYYNNPPGPASYGAYRSHRAMAPVPSRRYYTNSFDSNQRCLLPPSSLEYTGGCY
jgi:hypothetical protein